MKNILISLLICISITIAQTDHFNLEEWETNSLVQTNLLPMYGEQEFTNSQVEANEKFLSNISIGKLKSDIRGCSNTLAEVGWDFLYKGQLDTAIFRFNQSWLIDSTNIAPYIGFGTVYLILGDSKKSSVMYNIYSKNDSISEQDFQDIINKNLTYFRKLEQLEFKLDKEYVPFEYYSTGQLFKDRKKLEMDLYHWRWFHPNGNFMRIVNGGEKSHDWRGEVTNYHDNGIISYQGQWDDNLNNQSIWTSYDREGNISKIEYWEKKSKESSYSKVKSIIFKQEIPWDKNNYVTISEEGWVESNTNFPDGYIMKVYNLEDSIYDYYAIWKNGKRSEQLIKVIPENRSSMTLNGNFEWFNGKLYKID